MPNLQWEWNQTQSSGLSVNSFIDEWIHPSCIFKLYRIIPILRLLKVKRTQPDLYKATVERFESHWEERKQQPEAANFIKYIGAFIRWWRHGGVKHQRRHLWMWSQEASWSGLGEWQWRGARVWRPQDQWGGSRDRAGHTCRVPLPPRVPDVTLVCVQHGDQLTSRQVNCSPSKYHHAWKVI